MAILINVFEINWRVTLQEILTSHIFGLEFPRVHNVSAHFIPHVTYLPSRQGFRQTCYLGKSEGSICHDKLELGDKKPTTHFKGWAVCDLVIPRRDWEFRWELCWPWEICLSARNDCWGVPGLWSDKDSFRNDFISGSSVGTLPFEVGLFVKVAAHVNPQVG